MPPMQSGGPPQIAPPTAVMDQNLLQTPSSVVGNDDEPPNKKLRSEDNLVPENEFIALHKVLCV